jgi:polysaccharide pyruvyl transferase WcaK-like protein
MFSTLQNLAFTLFAKLIISKPMVLVPASIGYFKNRFVKLMAKIILNQYDLIAVRGEISKKYLQDLGVDRPLVYLADDLGFLLDSCSLERTSELLKAEGITPGKELLVGLSPSDEISGWAFPDINDKKKKRVKYIQLMATITDYMIERYNATICFIPNIRNDKLTKGSGDAFVVQQIIQSLKHKNCVKIISNQYSAEETKGIIGACDIYLSSRMHAAIASVSMGVPTVVMTYGLKFDDVIGGTIGQGSHMVRVDTSYSQIIEELKLKIDNLYVNRNWIKNELIEKTRLARQSAMLFGKLVKQIAEPSANA